VQNNTVKLMPVDHDSCLDKLLDYIPDLMQKMNEACLAFCFWGSLPVLLFQPYFYYSMMPI
jgi:hypothetical protein